MNNNELKLKKYSDYLVKWLKKEVSSANAKGVVFGLSGGVDSSVVSMIAKAAFPKNHMALIMPYDKNTLDYNLAKKLVNDKDINYKEINLDNISKPFFDELQNNNKLIKGNSLARFRMLLLYAHAQLNNYLVLGTDNVCEWYIGYFTKFGDGAADLFPIIKLLKQEVRSMARILGIPKEIINRDPTASLWIGQTDESELQFTYDELDNFLLGNDVNYSSKQKINNLHLKTQHKRQKGSVPRDFSIEIKN